MKIAIAESDGAIRRNLEAGSVGGDDRWVGLDPDYVEELLEVDDLQVLVLDWALPGLDGAELCRRIRSRDQTRPYLFVIAMVADDRPEARASVYSSGADAVVGYPCDPLEILARLDVARRIIRREEDLRSRWFELEQARLDLENQNATLSEMASSDALTGLRNRRFFLESLDMQFSLARRKEMPLSLVMIDVDQFKLFNDRFGHPAGDDVLREVGALLRSCVRDHDVVARYGGEEFAILLPATNVEDCVSLIDRLRLTIAAHPWRLRPVTISLGATTLRAGDQRPTDLVDRADRSLYDSKALGRNRATYASELVELTASPLGSDLIDRPSFRETIPAQAFDTADHGALPTTP